LNCSRNAVLSTVDRTDW